MSRSTSRPQSSRPFSRDATCMAVINYERRKEMERESIDYNNYVKSQKQYLNNLSMSATLIEKRVALTKEKTDRMTSIYTDSSTKMIDAIKNHRYFKRPIADLFTPDMFKQVHQDRKLRNSIDIDSNLTDHQTWNRTQSARAANQRRLRNLDWDGNIYDPRKH